MAFPTSGLVNNLVHKEGNRSFVFDSATSVWDRVREADSSNSNNDIQSGNIGSVVTGFTGIKHAVLWRVHTGFTGGAVDPIVNWERDDTYSNGFVGSAMSESSGIFTFPETGVWDIAFHMSVYYTAPQRYINGNIYTTTNNGSGWDHNAMAETSIGDSGTSNVMGSISTRTLFNVSAVGTHKCKLTMSNVGSDAISVRGDQNTNYTFAVFTRLGDA